MKLADLLELADELDGRARGELDGVIELAEVRPGEYAQREPPSTAARRVLARIENAQKQINRWRK